MPRGIYKRTPKQITKLIERNKLGQSKETRKKISEWNKKNPNKFWLGKKRPLASDETKRKMSESQKKVIHTSEWSKKVGKALKGRKRNSPSKETKRKLSEALKGNKSYLWKGGISTINDKARHNLEMRIWRKAVLERDNFTCQKCGNKKSGSFNAHHIKNFAEVIELRTSIENGITFCNECHKRFHNKYGYKNNTQEQIIEFLSL